MNGNTPLAIVIFEQQRIIHVDPCAPFIRASRAAHKDISSLTTKTKYPRGRSSPSADHSARKRRRIETQTPSTSQADQTKCRLMSRTFTDRGFNHTLSAGRVLPVCVRDLADEIGPRTFLPRL